jgi:hypothetical protein
MNFRFLAVVLFLLPIALPAIACDEDDPEDCDQVEYEDMARDNYNSAADAAEEAGNYALADQLRQLAEQAQQNARSLNSLNPGAYVGAPRYSAPAVAAPRYNYNSTVSGRSSGGGGVPRAGSVR